MAGLEKELYRMSFIDELKAKRSQYGVVDRSVARKFNEPEKITLGELQDLVKKIKLNPNTVIAFIFGERL